MDTIGVEYTEAQPSCLYRPLRFGFKQQYESIDAVTIWNAIGIYNMWMQWGGYHMPKSQK